MKKNSKNLYLIDGHALCYRAFYAIKELSNSKGMPTNAIYGVLTMLKRIIKKYDPEMMAFAFDSKGKTQRHQKYDQYKIQRKPMPDDLSVQIPAIIKVVEALNIPIFRIEGFEADDIIATLAKKAEAQGLDVTIVTGDKDALQLVNDKIKVLSSNGPQDKIYGVKDVEKKYGVSPELLIEFMALVGDTSDNIPGVKGVGPVSAQTLISKFGSLSGVFQNINKIDKDTLKEKLHQGRLFAELSLDLLRLDTDVPLDLDLQKTVLGDADNDKLIELFREFEFNGFLKELVSSEEEKGSYQKDLRHQDLDKLFARIRSRGLFSFAVAMDEKKMAYGIAISVEPKESYFIRFDVSTGSLSGLREIFQDASIKKISYDIKNKLHALKGYGLGVSSNDFDVMLAEYVIDPSRINYELTSMAMRSLGYNMSHTDNPDWDNSGQASIDFGCSVDLDSVCEESDVTLRLYNVLSPLLRKKEMLALFEGVEMPLTEVLYSMEESGVAIDIQYLNTKSIEIENELEELTNEIYEVSGHRFNINSTKQLQTILFEKLKLPVVRKNKTGVSTDEFVLRKLSAVHPLPRILLKYRELNKLKTGYYDSIKNLVSSDGRLHAKFNQAVTATGRLSSSEPNLQNIPIKTNRGRELRKAFVPSHKDNILVAADYSQIELRVLAYLSRDAALIEAFKGNKDVHTYTASLLYECELSDVTKEMRSVAKTVNFGIVYGISSFGLSKDLDISVKDAQKFIEAYFERYKDVKGFIDNTISFAKKKGYVTTIMNRRRYIPGINSANERLKGFAERVAVNTPVQGSAADMIKLAMIKCFKELNSSDIKMLIQVHDELVFEVHKNRLQESSEKIKNIMENVMELDVPIKVDIEAGPNWLEIKKIDI